jgi:hypothetical protein
MGEGQNNDSVSKIMTLLRSSQMMADLGVPRLEEEDLLPVGHAVPVSRLALIHDEDLFKAHTQILVEQINEARKNQRHRADVFFLTGFERLSSDRLNYLTQIAGLADKNSVVFGDPDQNFKGVVVQYTFTDQLKEMPALPKDQRTIFVPISGFTENQLLGWYAVFHTGGELGHVFARYLKTDEDIIDFNRMTAADVADFVLYYVSNTNLKNVLPGRFLSLLKADWDEIRGIDALKRLSFILPITRLKIGDYVRGARMAMRQVEMAA